MRQSYRAVGGTVQYAVAVRRALVIVLLGVDITCYADGIYHIRRLMTQPAVVRAESASTQRRVVMFARHRFLPQLISSKYQTRVFTGEGQGRRPMFFFFAFLEGVEVLLRGAPFLRYVPRFAPAGRISLRTAERTRLLRDIRGGG